ncbi:MAG: hypothetical protein QOD77_1288 [Thermoplasmata archaeon]|jgi:hypothetical protein|nr:hypothetical protein [Thermoplasmata archaeon]
MDEPYTQQPTQPATGLERAAAAAAGAAEGLADGIRRSRLEHHANNAYTEMVRVRDAATGTEPTASAAPPNGKVQAAIARTGAAVRNVADDVRERAEAIGEASRRAREAPGHIATDLKEATGAYAKGLAASIGLWAVAGALGAAAFVVLTVFLVDGLSMILGAPWGALAVALLYGIGVAVTIGMARAAQARGKHAAANKLEHAREEVRRVARPVRRAFRGRAPATRTWTPAPTTPLSTLSNPGAGPGPSDLNDLR